MNNQELLSETEWKFDDTSKIPFWAYTNKGIYEKELKNIFYKNTGVMLVLKQKYLNQVTLNVP